MRRSAVTAWGALLVAGAVTLGRSRAQHAPSPSGTATPPNDFTPCHVMGVRQAARCGTIVVPARPEAPQGPSIALHVAVLPAKGAPAEADPVFLLAGGPGQAASDLGPAVALAFDEVQKHRDIVLVDQRGTGLSGALKCPEIDDTPYDEEASLATLRKCRARWPEDLGAYTTAAHVHDLETVRARLGYERIDLWGGSYGTRVAQEYMKSHPERLRSVVLDGVVPPSVPLTLHIARDAQASLALLAQACDANQACKTEVGSFAQIIGPLTKSLAADPRPVTMAHPSTGKATDVVVDGDAFAGGLRAALYSSTTAVQLPFAVVQAEKGNFAPFFALAEAGRGATSDTMALGLLLAVACAEDLPRVTPEEAKAAGVGTFVGVGFDRLLRRMCETLGPLPAVKGVETFAHASTPTLVLSGEADPVTPPGGAEEVVKGLPHVWHAVARAQGHGVSPSRCGAQVLADFYRQGHGAGLDFACFDKGERPPFTLSTLGPVEASR